MKGDGSTIVATLRRTLAHINDMKLNPAVSVALFSLIPLQMYFNCPTTDGRQIDCDLKRHVTAQN